MHQTQYRLHHVGLLCAETAVSAQVYQQQLGHQLLAAYQKAGTYDLTFLRCGSDLLLELVGAPFSEGEQAFMQQRGGGIHHLAFETDDVDAAFSQLTAVGLRPAWEPDDFLFVRHCGIYDDCGNVVEILQMREPFPAMPTPQPAPPLQLHHLNILSDDWQRSQQFYETHFGLRTVYEYRYDSGGAFLYLADPFFDLDSHHALLQIMGPPYAEARASDFVARFGTGLDHLGYIASDVRAAAANLAARGTAVVQPLHDAAGTLRAWLQDHDGNALALTQPVPASYIQRAFRRGTPYRVFETLY